MIIFFNYANAHTVKTWFLIIINIYNFMKATHKETFLADTKVTLITIKYYYYLISLFDITSAAEIHKWIDLPYINFI